MAHKVIYSIESKVPNRSCYNDVFSVRDENRGFYIGKKYKKENLYKNERNILNKLTHDNIVRMLYSDDEQRFIVFEYIHGQTLLKLMRRHRKTVYKKHLIQLIHTLKYIHTKNVIYCDLKPDNVIIQNDGRVKLIDFDRSLNMDAWCSYGYSLDYASAESRHELPRIASDVWSLGILLYEMYTGRTPFEKYTSSDTKHAIKLGHIDFTVIKDPVLFDLLTKMLNKDHTKRPTLDEVLNHAYMIS
jgi:protein kinase A